MPQDLYLIGEHPATLDGEGRIQLPVALRDDLNPRATNFNLMGNLEPDGSICLREREDWVQYVSSLKDATVESARARRALTFLAAHSAPVKCDKTGRIRIPDALLVQVGLDRNDEQRRDVILVGNFGDIRVWSPEGWVQFRDEARGEYAAGLDDLLTHKRLGPKGLVDRETA
ncbi:MAG: hypothetical protein R3F33_14860 [Planctomycetota bacterium]